MVKLIKTREEYFANPALNSSTLKAMASDPASLVFGTPDISHLPGVIFGTAVDTLLFDGLAKYNNDFISMSLTLPTETSLILVEEAKRKNVYREDDVLTIADELTLWKSTKAVDKRKEKIKPAVEYLKALVEAGDRTIITKDDADNISQCVYYLKKDKFTSQYITGSPINALIALYQVAFTFEYRGITMKAMLDSVIVDNVNKTIQPVDVKTTGDKVTEFAKAVLKFRYDLQAELYTEAIKSWANVLYPDYTVVTPFVFVVVSRQKPSMPLVYTLDPVEFRKKYNTVSYNCLRGLDSLVDEFKLRRSKLDYEYPLGYLNEGKIEL